MGISMQALLSILRRSLPWFDRNGEKDMHPQLESLFTRGAPSKQKPPDCPGIYRFINKYTGKLTYIGISINLSNRLRWHRRYTYSIEEYDFAWKSVNRIVRRRRRILI